MFCPTCKKEEMVFVGETTGSDALWCPFCGTVTGSVEGEFITPTTINELYSKEK